MGIYVNPKNTAFRKTLNADIYIDKTELIRHTNNKIDKPDCFLCVSRPRRFGKSTAADMLVAYYSKGCESGCLFSGKKAENIDSFQTHLNRHNVIRLDVQRFLETEEDLITLTREIEHAVMEELAEEFPDCADIIPGIRLKTALGKIFQKTESGFIFIIDEWDCVFRMAKNRKAIQKEYLDFLRGLFKGSDYVELAYMTGILPIKKYGEHSAINVFDEYSMVDSKDLGQYFGFTPQEVADQCLLHDMDYLEFEKWYDGYILDGGHIYNPKSVIDALKWKKIKSYWTGTETYEALKVYIDMNFDGLKEAVTVMLANGQCKINTRKFQNDMTTFSTKDDVLTLLVHLGYLTFDEAKEVVYIPNREISQEFLNAIDGSGWNGLTKALTRSDELLQRTWALDGPAVAGQIAAIHSETASILQYNSENALACTILIAYYSAKAYYLNPIMEFPSGKGFADVVYLPRPGVDRPALVVELKWNKSAQGAVSQIKDRGYTDWIAEYTGEILLIGLNYDKGSKSHHCVIEKYMKH